MNQGRLIVYRNRAKARRTTPTILTQRYAGTRSVSTLNPSQLARKRARDREAQRIIRTRTKEHIERLERDLKELKSNQSSDQTVKELLRRNKALEEELIRLKSNTGAPMTSSPYSVPDLTPRQLSLTSKVYDHNLSTGSHAIPSTCESPFPGDYNSFFDHSQQYVPLPNHCESWASTTPCSTPSNFSTPSSTVNAYGADCVPTSAPTLILPCNNTSSSSTSVTGHQ